MVQAGEIIDLLKESRNDCKKNNRINAKLRIAHITGDKDLAMKLYDEVDEL